MRIALICPYDMGRFGGVQNQVALMVDSLNRRGHEAWPVGPGQSASAGFRSLGKSRTWSVNDSAAPIKLSPTLVPRLRRAVASAEVVHVHEPLMPLVGLAARWTQRPLVGTFHADPSRFVRRIYRRLPPLRWHLAAFSALAAVSEVARSAVACFGEVELIPNGVATDGLPQRDRIPGRIAFVGRDDPRKGLDIALAAVEKVRSEHHDAHLVVISPDAVAQPDGVTLYRGVDDAAKAELLATSEIFVAPNRRGESFGLTVAEGLAAGTACVVSDIPAFAAVTGEAALRVEPGSSAALAAGIMSLLADRDRMRQLAAAGRARAGELSIERTVDAYLPLYERAIGVNSLP